MRRTRAKRIAATCTLALSIAAPAWAAEDQPGWHAAAGVRTGVTDNSAAVRTGQAGSITDTFVGGRVEGGYLGQTNAHTYLANYNAALNMYMRDQRTSVFQTLNLRSESLLSPTAELGLRASGQYGTIGDLDTLLSPSAQAAPLDLTTDVTRPTGNVTIARLTASEHLTWRLSPRFILDQKAETSMVSPSGGQSPLQRSVSATSDNTLGYRWPRQTFGLRARGDVLRAYPRQLSSGAVGGRDLAAAQTTLFLQHNLTPLWHTHFEAGTLFLFPHRGSHVTTYAGTLATTYTMWSGAAATVELVRGARPNPLIGEIFLTERALARYTQPLRQIKGWQMRIEGGLQREETVASLGEDPVKLRVAYATASVGYGISRNLNVSLNYQLRVQRASVSAEGIERFPSFTRNLVFVSLEGRYPHGGSGSSGFQ